MSDPLLSFICEQEESSSSATRVDFVPTSSPIDDDQAELSLFPELLGSGEVDVAGKVAALKTKPEKTQTQGKTTVVKVKMVPKPMQNPEEQLIEYLTGRCEQGGFDVENIVDVTELSDISDDTTFDLAVGDFELGETAPTRSSRSVGKRNCQQTFNDSSEFTSLSGRPPCSLSASKAAQAARENRIKKKNYIAGLQKNVNDLSTENRQLKTEVGNLKSTVDSLSTEVLYLKNVLANQSALSSLLKNTLKTPGIQFLASEFEDCERETVTNRKTTKRSLEEDLFLSSDEDGESVVEPVVSMHRKKSVPSRMATRLGSRKMTKLDHDYAGFEKKAYSTKCASGSLSDDNVKENINNNSEDKAGSGGICLHVSNKTVSMEFCSECSKRASITRRRQQARYSGNRKIEQVQV